MNPLCKNPPKGGEKMSKFNFIPSSRVESQNQRHRLAVFMLRKRARMTPTPRPNYIPRSTQQEVAPKEAEVVNPTVTIAEPKIVSAIEPDRIDPVTALESSSLDLHIKRVVDEILGQHPVEPNETSE